MRTYMVTVWYRNGACDLRHGVRAESDLWAIRTVRGQPTSTRGVYAIIAEPEPRRSA